MDFLGIGPLELGLILILAILIIGPRDLVKVTRTLGVWFRKLATSEAWLAMRRATQEVRTLPDRLAREAGLDEVKRDLNQVVKPVKPVSGQGTPDVNPAWTSPPDSASPPGSEPLPGTSSPPGTSTPPAPAPDKEN